MKGYSGSEVTASAGVAQYVTHPPKHSQGPLLSVCFLWGHSTSCGSVCVLFLTLDSKPDQYSSQGLTQRGAVSSTSIHGKPSNIFQSEC